MVEGISIFTTSRYASKETRALARKLAAGCGERYVARGKKTVAELAEAARRLGEMCVSVVEELKKRPARIAVMKVDELGRWSWVEEKLLNQTEKTDNG